MMIVINLVLNLLLQISDVGSTAHSSRPLEFVKFLEFVEFPREVTWLDEVKLR